MQQIALALVASCTLASQATEPSGPSVDTLGVLYVFDDDQPDARHEAFEEFLATRFDPVRVASPDAVARADMEGIDVVVLDWSQSSSDDEECPLGRREDWKLPTVLLGSAGLKVAMKWEVLGGSG